MGPSVQLAILGSIEVRGADGTRVQLGGTRQRALLTVLALHAGEVVSTDRLVDDLWGERPPATAVHTIQVFVSRLRRALGPAAEHLVTRPPGYVLEISPDDLDAARCERLYQTARSALAAGRPADAAEKLREAEALWRGPPLADFAYERFAQAAIARLEELRLSCREELIEAQLALGCHAEVIAELEALVREQPFRERPRQQLMLALYRSGRQADALEAYQDARRTFIEELGVEPSPALRELEGLILEQSDSLQPDPGVTTETQRETAADTGGGSAPTDAPVASAPRSVTPGGPTPERDHAASPPMVRRTATVLVARVSTAGRADPELGLGAIAAARREVDRVVSHHGGRLVSSLAREVIAVFGLPRMTEDDALRAVRAAQELRLTIAGALAEATDGLVVRIGLDTGEVVAETVHDMFGAPLDRALSLASIAAQNDILLTAATREFAGGALVTEMSPDETAWRLLDVVPQRPIFGSSVKTPMFGRQDELASACAVFARAVRERRAHLLTVLGEAGIGKSRFAQELVARVSDEATVLAGRCLAYGESITLWPLREAISSFAGGESKRVIDELFLGMPDAEVLSEITSACLGMTKGQAAPEQIPWAIRRLLEGLAAHRPLLVVIEDAHWAEPALRDLIDYLIDWLTAPVMIVCLARPELLDERPQWGGGHERRGSVVLTPLADEDARALVERHLGHRRISSAARGQVVATAEGNPLFVEQLLAIGGDDPAWTLDDQLPATIEALLAARLDRLETGERAFIERAAVIGREFWPSAVVELLSPEDRQTAGESLRELVRRGLLHPDRSSLAGEEQVRFHHLLIRDVAYHTTPKALRGDLHERFADWLTAHGETYDEFVGYHFERAFRYRCEIGRSDVATLEIARRAGEKFARAGRHALARGDTNGAVKLLRSAATLLEAGQDARPDVMLDLGSALSETGEFADAADILQSALRAAEATDAPVIRARAMIELSYWQSRAEPSAHVPEILAVAKDAIGVFERMHDDGGLARAWLHIAWAHWIRSSSAEMERALEQALEHAERAGERRERSRALTYLARCAVYGPRPVDDAIRRCHAILERARGDVTASAFTEAMLAVLEAMAGRCDDARARWRASKHRLAEFGLTHLVAVIQISYAFIELLDGIAADAEAELAEACETFERIGDQGRLSSAAAALARLDYDHGDYGAADHYSRVSEAVASPDDVEPQVLWRGTRAKFLARAGEEEAARRLSDSAVALSRTTDFLMLQGDALADRAEVLTLLGHHEAAASDLEQATAVYRQKGIQRRHLDPFGTESDLAGDGTSTGVA